MNFRLSPSCQFFFHYEVTRIARVYKNAATNDNSLDLDPFNRKLALVGIIPNHFFSFSSDKDRRTDSRIRRKKKTQRSPAGNRTQDLANSAQFTSVCACAKKMASAELGVVRLGVSGFDKEFAD